MSTTNLSDLSAAKEAVTEAETALTNRVLALRQLPAGERPSWAQIGSALGIGGSSAYSRFGVGPEESLAEARAARLERSRKSKASTRDRADLGLSASAAAKALGVDPRTLVRGGDALSSRYEKRLTALPSGRYAERYFLT